MAAIHRLTKVLLDSMFWLFPVNPLRRILPRALSYRIARSAVPGHIRITVHLELRIPFQRDDPEPEIEVEVEEAELDEMLEPPDPAAHAPLLRSLHGIL